MKKLTCICGKTKYSVLFRAGPYMIATCSTCGLARTVHPKGKRVRRFYEHDDLTVYSEKEQVFRSLFREILSFIRPYRPLGLLVDIGAGSGLLVDEARKLGYDAIGFEPSKSAVSLARKIAGVRLKQSEFSPLDPKKKAEIIILNHVLEHIPKPIELLSDVTDSLILGGLLVVGVPNFGSIMAKIKKERWQSLVPDQHVWHFRLLDLDAAILPLGYERIAVKYENHDRSMHPWWKRPVYLVLDRIALRTGKGEAMLAVYRKRI